MNITQEPKHTVSTPTRPNRATSKKQISISLMAALLALLSSASPGMAGQAPVELGWAGSFAILSKSGITDVPTSAITGNVGTSPITGAAITGLECGEVTGTIYTVNAAGFRNRAGVDAHVSGDSGIGAGHCRSSQNRETLRRTQIWRDCGRHSRGGAV